MSLREAAVKSTVWSVLENTISQILSFVVFLVLARMLNPQAYGVIALASMFTVFLATISAFGVEQTIVQRKELLSEHLTSAFYLSLRRRNLD